MLSPDVVPPKAAIIAAKLSVLAFVPGLMLAPAAKKPVFMAKAYRAENLPAMVLLPEMTGMMPLSCVLVMPSMTPTVLFLHFQAAVTGIANQRQDGF